MKVNLFGKKTNFFILSNNTKKYMVKFNDEDQIKLFFNTAKVIQQLYEKYSHIYVVCNSQTIKTHLNKVYVGKNKNSNSTGCDGGHGL